MSGNIASFRRCGREKALLAKKHFLQESNWKLFAIITIFGVIVLGYTDIQPLLARSAISPQTP